MIDVRVVGNKNPLAVTSKGKVPVEMTDDFTVSVSNGEIPRYSHYFNIAYMPSLSTTLQTVWGAGGDMSLPASLETYEIVSSSADDDISGTGARLVLVETLNSNGVPQTNVAAMSGTTPALVPGIHSFPRSMIVISSGSLMHNAGNITLRVSGAGSIRDYMLAGDSAAFSSMYKVPSNKYFHLSGLDYHTGGAAKKTTIKSQVLLEGTNTWVTTSTIPSVQQSFTRDFKISARYDPNTIVRYQANISTGTGDDLAVILLGYEVDL